MTVEPDLMAKYRRTDSHKRDTGQRVTRYHYTVGQGIPEHLIGDIERRLQTLSSGHWRIRFEHDHGNERVKSKRVPKNIQTRKLRRGVLIEAILSHEKLWRVVIRCPAYHHEPAQDLSVVMQWDINNEDILPTLVTAWWNDPNDWHRLTSEDSRQYKE